MTTQNLIFIIVAAIAALLIAIFQYFYKIKNRNKVNILLTFLRFLSLFSLFLLFLNLKVTSSVLKTLKPNLVVAVDNSKSINYLNGAKDVKNTIDKLKSNSALNEKFDITYFSFSDAFQQLDSLNFNGTQSNIAKPIKEIENLYNNTISPIILISDGNQTYGRNYEYLDYKKPVYPVIIGDTVQYEDIRIEQQNVNRYTYLKNKFPVETFINYEGEKLVNASFTVMKGNQKVYSKNLTLSKDNSSQSISYNLPSPSVGTHFYTSRISFIDNEKNKQNNTRDFVVEVVDEQSKVLILTSFLHPDIGMLRTSIETNKQRKVDVKQVGEKVNFTDYQMVILYQPTNAFKSAFEQIVALKINSLVITGTKTDWDFLNTIQSDFSKSWISSTENYSPLFNETFSTFITDDIDFQNFPPLTEKFGEVKFNVPFQSMLYQKVGNYFSTKPLLAVWENDAQKQGLLLGENIWRWRMNSYVEARSFQEFDNYISGIVQYLSAKEIKNRLSIDAKSTYFTDESVKINANFLDKNLRFNPNARLWLSVKNNETNELIKIPFSVANNNFSSQIDGLSSGTYNYIVSVDNESIKRSGSFKVLAFDVEQQHSNSNLKTLENVAKKSNGDLFFPSSLEELTSKLLEDNRFQAMQTSETKKESLIDWKWLLGLIILSLSIEWFIRKYNGLI